MKYTIVIIPTALRHLQQVPLPFRRQIDARIRKLADDPRPPGAKALKGEHKGFYRIRQGDYRIIYHVADDKLIVTVVKIGDRKDVYD